MENFENLSYVLDTRNTSSYNSDVSNGSDNGLSAPPRIPDSVTDDEGIKTIEINREPQREATDIEEKPKLPENGESLAVAIIPDRSIVPVSDGIIEYKYDYPPGIDVVVLKMTDYNPRFMQHFNNLRHFFNEDEVIEGRTNITAFLAKSDIVSMNNVFTCNKDSLALRIDFPEGFIDYMSEAANEAEENVVDMGKYNLYDFEQKVRDKTLNKDTEDGPTASKRRRTMVSSNRCVKSLTLRGTKMISTFDGRFELEKPLSACRAWFSGILESKSVMSASKKQFSSFFLRPNEMQTTTYINGELRCDDYMQITKAIYITTVASPFRLYTLDAVSKVRTSRMETNMDSLKDKEVYIEFTNMEVTLLNSLRLLVKGVVKRVIELDWITGAHL